MALIHYAQIPQISLPACIAVSLLTLVTGQFCQPAHLDCRVTFPDHLHVRYAQIPQISLPACIVVSLLTLVTLVGPISPPIWIVGSLSLAIPVSLITIWLDSVVSLTVLPACSGHVCQPDH